MELQKYIFFNFIHLIRSVNLPITDFINSTKAKDELSSVNTGTKNKATESYGLVVVCIVCVLRHNALYQNLKSAIKSVLLILCIPLTVQTH